MGRVWRAHHTALKRDDALKVLPDAFAADPERLARFQREAQVLASLNHPNIAHVYGLEEADSIKALVMELVEGPTLADRIGQGPIPVDEALSIAKQIAEGLETAHAQGIIHRDLKPANIKLRSDGTVKVLDFGLAKAMEPIGSMSPTVSQSPTITTPAMTQMGVILGTAAYMSPEQARAKPVDRRCDIWAFGCVLYEMLTGRRAFEDEDVSMTLSKVLQREPDFEAFPHVPPRVCQTVRLCLRKSLRERVGDIHDVRLALEGAFETVAPQVALATAFAQPVWRRPLVVASAMAIVAVLVTSLAAWSLWPTVEPVTVNRFDYVLPEGQRFRNLGRAVIAFSPDGRHLVYNATGGLHLRSMDALEAQLISGTDGRDLTNPFFSPNGESVGFFENGQLKRIGISGGAAVVICGATNPFGVSWGPDNMILFGQPEGIMRVSANGGTPELVIKANEGEEMYGPQLLPHGDSVLFSSTRALGTSRWDAAQIVVQSLATGMRTVVVQGGSDARYFPTGHLVYALEGALFAVAFDVDRLAVTGGAVPQVQGVMRASGLTGAGAANYGVSNGGTLVYVTRAAGLKPRTLVWAARDGREEPLRLPQAEYGWAQVSPDGSRVAVSMADAHGNQDVWVSELARGTLSRVTTEPEIDNDPVWTPDSRRIVFPSRRKDGRFGFYLAAADGTGAAELLLQSETGGFFRAYGWSRDGNTLVFDYADPKGRGEIGNIGILSIKSGRPWKPLLQTAAHEVSPALSPDGEWIAYASDQTGRLEVYMERFPDLGDRRQISTDGGVAPLWSPDGRELFYRRGDTMMVVAIVGGGRTLSVGNPQALFQGTYFGDNNGSRRYDIDPTGKRFLMIKENSKDEATPERLIVVQNWTEELKRLVPSR